MIQCPIVWLGTRPWPRTVNLYVTVIGSDIMWEWDILKLFPCGTCTSLEDNSESLRLPPTHSSTYVPSYIPVSICHIMIIMSHIGAITKDMARHVLNDNNVTACMY